MTGFAAGQQRRRDQAEAARPDREPPRRNSGTIRRSVTTVGSASDPAEREADAIAEQVVRAVATGGATTAVADTAHRVQRAHPGDSSTVDTPRAQRLQRSPATGAAPVIRRKIGNDGTPLVGRKVRKLDDPSKVGTITSWNYGGAVWSLTGAMGWSNVVYVVDFPDGVQSITANDEAYELAPPSSTVPQQDDSKPPPSKPARDAVADAKTVGSLEELIGRLGEPLTGMSNTQGLSHTARKNLVKELQTAKSKPELLPDAAALKLLTARVVEVETSFSQYATEVAAAKLLKEQTAAAEKQRLAKEAQDAKAKEALDKANKDRAGKLFGQLKSQVPDAAQLAELLKLTPLGEEGQLSACLQDHSADGLAELFVKIKPKAANALLRAIPARAVAQLSELLDHVKPGEHDKLGQLLDRTADDKATLVKLLTQVGNSAAEAWKLMSKASAGSEASVLAMLVAGRSAGDTATLVNTAGGRADTADAATVSAGVADLATAKTLLEQPGVSGNATQALAVLQHASVNGDIAVATELLNKHGNASDALALLQHGCSLDDAEHLLATSGITGAGADAVWCLQQGCSAADLVTLLSARTAEEIRSYVAAGFTFVFVKTQLAAAPGQQFWAGEQCGEPAFSGTAASIDDIIRTATFPPAVGGYSGSNRFGNHGGVDDRSNPVMFLPPGNYREYDLRPFSTPGERGTRRIVVGGPGNHRYFTDDHYGTFQRFA